jgi:hypothetical protein
LKIAPPPPAASGANPLTWLPPAWTHALAGYPLWVEIAVGIVVGVALLWVLGKLLKLAFYLLLVAGAAGVLWLGFWALWDLFHPAIRP